MIYNKIVISYNYITISLWKWQNRNNLLWTMLGNTKIQSTQTKTKMTKSEK